MLKNLILSYIYALLPVSALCINYNDEVIDVVSTYMTVGIHVLGSRV